MMFVTSISKWLTLPTENQIQDDEQSWLNSDWQSKWLTDQPTENPNLAGLKDSPTKEGLSLSPQWVGISG